MYRRCHCFTRVPREADAREKTRLENHGQLIRIADAEGAPIGRVAGEGVTMLGEFSCLINVAMSASWAEILSRILFVVSCGSGCSTL